MRLAYQALKEGGTLPCFMNAANEVLVQRFLNKEISWVNIGRKLEQLMNKHKAQQHYDIDMVHAVEQEARAQAIEI